MPQWGGTTNPYALTRADLDQLRAVNPSAAGFYERFTGTGRRPQSAQEYTMWKHGLESLSPSGYRGMSFFPATSPTSGYAQTPAERGMYDRPRPGGGILGVANPQPGGGGGLGGPGGGATVPGYLRSFFGYLGREALREQGRSGVRMAPGTLGRLQTGYDAAAADYIRQMMGPQREAAFGQRGLEAQRAGAMSAAEQAAAGMTEQERQLAGGIQSAYLGGQAQMMGYQEPTQRARKPMAAQPRAPKPAERTARGVAMGVPTP